MKAPDGILRLFTMPRFPLMLRSTTRHILAALALPTLALPLVSTLTAAETVAPPDLQWWRDGRFGMFIHWGPVLITGEEISFSRAKSNPYAPHGFGATPVRSMTISTKSSTR